MKYEITIYTENKKEVLCAEEGVSLHSLLSDSGYPLSSPCGGNGRCGKCKVFASGDFLPPYGKVSDVREIQACKAFPSGSCHVHLNANSHFSSEALSDIPASGNLGIAFDVGTTSISAVLCTLDEKRELSSLTCKNAQAAFGADIVTRISQDAKKLSSVLVAQINSITEKLCPDTSRISKLTFSANTVMSHYIAGISPEGLASFPLTPADTFGKTYSAKELGFVADKADVYIFPSLASFVGGDISSGLFSLNLPATGATTLLIDIGTNGEMALCKNGRIFVASAAAGPAFEGGELSCGMPAEPGAVTGFDVASFTTVGNLPPRGIAGSGAIDLLAQLSSIGVIDKGGRLLPPDEAPFFRERLSFSDGEVVFSISGNVFLSATDIRKLQLAKAAIRAALSLLLIRSETTICEIDSVYIAGAFASSVNPENAAKAGLIPPELLPVCIPVGNASLDGACKALYDNNSLSKLIALQKNTTHIELSGDSDFEDEFLKHIHM